MTLQDTALPPTIALRVAWDAARCGGPMWPPADIALALALFTVWAARTGRALRAVPVTDLFSEELIDFWADDQIDYLPAAPACRRLP
jgi:hypothetical protein